MVLLYMVLHGSHRRWDIVGFSEADGAKGGEPLQMDQAK
jgi:hypothetical protein